MSIFQFICGFVGGAYLYPVVFLPIFYGLPKTIYFVSKGILNASALRFAIFMALMWPVIFIALGFFFPHLLDNLSTRPYLELGMNIGGYGSLLVCFITRKQRERLAQKFWKTAEIHLKV